MEAIHPPETSVNFYQNTRLHAQDVYSGDVQFESRYCSRFSSVPPGTSLSFQILSNLSYIYHPTIRRYTVSDTDSVAVEYGTKRHIQGDSTLQKKCS
jgi:hypothetical protein